MGKVSDTSYQRGGGGGEGRIDKGDSFVRKISIFSSSSFL